MPQAVFIDLTEDEPDDRESHACNSLNKPFTDVASDDDEEDEDVDEDEDEEEEEEEDEDEVIFVGERQPKRRNRRCVNTATEHQQQQQLFDFSDDCVVLEHDPDKIVGNNPHHPQSKSNADSDSDDIVVTGEKGPVACRDFPHSRHLCVKFPFTSTPHFMFCQMCHCYACDKPAPCSLWGSGNSGSDHCHASDREEKWKRERNATRTSKTQSSSSTATQSSSNPNTTLSNPGTTLAITTHSTSSIRNININTYRVAPVPVSPGSLMARKRPIWMEGGLNQIRSFPPRAEDRQSQTVKWIQPLLLNNNRRSSHHYVYRSTPNSHPHDGDDFSNRSAGNQVKYMGSPAPMLQPDLTLSLNPHESSSNSFHGVKTSMYDPSFYQGDVNVGNSRHVGNHNQGLHYLADFLFNNDEYENESNQAPINPIENRGETSGQLGDINLSPASLNSIDFSSNVATNPDIHLPHVNFSTNTSNAIDTYHQDFLPAIPDFGNEAMLEHGSERNFGFDWGNSYSLNSMNNGSETWSHGVWNGIASRSPVGNNEGTSDASPQKNPERNDIEGYRFVSEAQADINGNPRLDLSLDQALNSAPSFEVSFCMQPNTSWEAPAAGHPNIYF